MKTMPVKCSNCGIEFQKPITYIKQGQQRGYLNHFCSNRCSRIYNIDHFILISSKKRKDDYYKNPKICPNCRSTIRYENRLKNVYCSSKCSSTYTQRFGGNHKWTDEEKECLSKKAKNLTFYFRKRIIKSCQNCNTSFEIIPSQKNKNCCCRKCKNEWIVKTGYLKNRGNGGYREHSGTSRKGWYKGIFCGSSWELAWVIFQLDHGIKFQRNNTGFEYKFDGKVKKYYPDFVIGDEYIEIKNYRTAQVDAKSSQFPHRLKILYKQDLSHVFDYVISKYGKNFTSLYEKN